MENFLEWVEKIEEYVKKSSSYYKLIESSEKHFVIQFKNGRKAIKTYELDCDMSEMVKCELGEGVPVFSVKLSKSNGSIQHFACFNMKTKRLGEKLFVINNDRGYLLLYYIDEDGLERHVLYSDISNKEEKEKVSGVYLAFIKTLKKNPKYRLLYITGQLEFTPSLSLKDLLNF